MPLSSTSRTATGIASIIGAAAICVIPSTTVAQTPTGGMGGPGRPPGDGGRGGTEMNLGGMGTSRGPMSGGEEDGMSGEESAYGGPEYGESDYGGGMQGGIPNGGGMNGSGPAGGLPGMGGPMANLMGSFPIEAFIGPPPAEVSDVPELIRDARAAFRNGDYPLALDLYRAQLIVDPEKADEVVQSVGYCGSLKRPLWSVRFGVAMAVRGDATGSPNPIAASEASGNGGMGAGMRGGGMGMGMGMGMGEGMDEGMGMDMGGMGGPGMGMDMGGMGMGGPGMNNARGGTASAVPTLNRPTLGDVPTQRLDEVLGGVASEFAAKFNSRYSQRQFGRAMVEIGRDAAAEAVPSAPPAAGGADTTPPPKVLPASSELVELMTELPEPPPLWQPAVVWLGEVGGDEALANARRHQIDFLFQIDVVLRAPKASANGGGMMAGGMMGRGGPGGGMSGGGSGATENNARVRLVYVPTGKSLVSTRSFNNLEAEQMVSRGQVASNNDYIEKQMGSFWTTVDRFITVVDMPNLQTNQAAARIGTLFDKAVDDPIAAMSEARLYQRTTDIPAEQIAEAMDMMNRETGLIFCYGPMAQRIEVVRGMIAEKHQRIRQTDN